MPGAGDSVAETICQTPVPVAGEVRRHDTDVTGPPLAPQPLLTDYDICVGFRCIDWADRRNADKSGPNGRRAVELLEAE